MLLGQKCVSGTQRHQCYYVLCKWKSAFSTVLRVRACVRVCMCVCVCLPSSHPPLPLFALLTKLNGQCIILFLFSIIPAVLFHLKSSTKDAHGSVSFLVIGPLSSLLLFQ